ncbi:damage-control phosphatase ARMT1 family protein [Kitasatospora sp. NPDC085879]|uniref:damage-control phosphatase ARMT1 family protein n=1 Tax=Kitasatospora sp. NPDC085879 TaxID=3154769 RepID=UPI003445D9BD
MPTAPVIRIDVSGSFPWSVFHRRHPELVRQVLAARPYGPAERAAVEDLLAESTTGLLSPPGTGFHDRDEWLAWGDRLWGRPWSEAPFLWAESWFHRRLLDATGYFRPGPWHGIDPFAPFKDAELAGEAVDGELAALDGLAELPQEARTRALLTSALWGNRADLSFRMAAGTEDTAASDLVADDSELLLAELRRARGRTVCVVADNAARELLPDLVLIDHLLAADPATRVVLHVKPQPYFVSDATTADVLAAVDRLRAAGGAAARAVGGRLWRALESGTLRIGTHAFFCAPLPYRDMPADLRTELADAAVTILKGDLNYRRLVGDRHWPPTTPFAAVADHFPSPVAALRTLKSDVAVGLTPATVTRLDTTNPTWRTAGTHALVQVHAPA